AERSALEGKASSVGLPNVTPQSLRVTPTYSCVTTCYELPLRLSLASTACNELQVDDEAAASERAGGAYASRAASCGTEAGAGRELGLRQLRDRRSRASFPLLLSGGRFAS